MTDSANLDLVRSIFADWERGDYSSTEWAHPEIEFVNVDGPSPGRWTGVAAMAEGARDWLDAWENASPAVDEYRELDDERVLVLVRYTGRGKVSRLQLGQLESKGAQLFHIRGGKVIRYAQYFQRDRALVDLGLDAEGGSEGCARMSERNIELTRRFTAVWNSRDVQATIAYCDPGIELHSTFAAIGGADYQGHDGIRRYFRDFDEAWGNEIRVEPEAYFDFGERTLVFHMARGRGRHSGAEVAMPVAVVYRWRDGLLVYLRGYTRREHALRDLGMSEDELEPIEP